MKKIPTIYQRDPINRNLVTGLITQGCEWVFQKEGVATRKERIKRMGEIG